MLPPTPSPPIAPLQVYNSPTPTVAIPLPSVAPPSPLQPTGTLSESAGGRPLRRSRGGRGVEGEKEGGRRKERREGVEEKRRVVWKESETREEVEGKWKGGWLGRVKGGGTSCYTGLFRILVSYDFNASTAINSVKSTCARQIDSFGYFFGCYFQPLRFFPHCMVGICRGLLNFRLLTWLLTSWIIDFLTNLTCWLAETLTFVAFNSTCLFGDLINWVLLYLRRLLLI